MGIESYSTTPASNTSLFPENMNPSAVNDGVRQIQADIRTWYQDPQWVNLGYTHTYASGTSFTIAGINVTSAYSIGRRVKAVGTSTGTIYGTISNSAFSTNTTVTITWDSGSLSNEALTIYIGILTSNNSAMPFNVPYTAASASGPASLAFAEDTDNGTNKVSVAAPSSVASDVTVTLPGVAGTLATLAGTETFTNKTLTSCLGNTAAADTNTTQLATTAFVVGQSASQSDQESASSTAKFVSPGRQQYHPSAAKAWVNFNGTGTVAIRASHNVDSITDNGTGDYTINLTTPFSSANWVATVSVSVNADNGAVGASISAGFPLVSNYTASSCRVIIRGNAGTDRVDCAIVSVSCFGDQ